MDYTAIAPNSRVTIPAGQTSVNYNIPIIDDGAFENQEQFQAELFLVPGTTPSAVTLGTPNPTTIQINDNDGL